MRHSALVLAAGSLLLAAGCGSPGGSAPGGKVPVEVVAFQGGYGIDFFQDAAGEYSKLDPKVEVKVTGDPRVWEALRPRLVAGDVPDLMFPGWGMDHWALVNDGALQELDAALDEKAYNSDQTWRSTFRPGLLDLCQKDGKTYMLPLYVMIYGWWYDPGVFAKNGWVPPQTWDELLDFGEKCKAKGVAPIAFQGQYPYYMIEGMLLPWACSIGGIEAVNAAQNLDPGAWSSPAMLQAAKMIAELRDKGFFLKGSVAMSHTEAQTQFLNGKAAMVPCGSWIEAEMKSTMPPGAQVAFMPVPDAVGGKGDPTALLIGIEPWMVPTTAKHPKEAIEFFRYMTSLDKAKQFVTEKGTLMAIQGSDDTEMPPSLEAPARALAGSKTVWSVQYRTWYPAMQEELEGAMTSLLNSQLTPEQFVTRCEAAADKTRKDSAVTKYKVSS
ncbi:MAG: extracellular solute-binding protein [Fimbriimonadaceae bacterium]